VNGLGLSARAGKDELCLAPHPGDSIPPPIAVRYHPAPLPPESSEPIRHSAPRSRNGWCANRL